MITAHDMVPGLAGGLPPGLAHPAVAPALAVPFKERLLLAVLYLTVLASSVAFIEPSPHDGLIFVLATAALVAGVRFDRLLALPLILFLIWDGAALCSLINVIGEEKATQSAFTTVYLTVAAVLWACLFSQNPLPRLATLRAAYIATAVLTTLAGLSGYFRLFPGAFDLFVQNGRAMGRFKDPNVFGPFLIWPALVIMERMMARAIRFFDVALLGVLLFGILLSFSRGAWFHFSLSAAVMIVLAIVTAPTNAARIRIFTLAAIGVGLLAVLLVVLLSFDSIGTFFQERAQLLQSYDTGSTGRFQKQEWAVESLLKYPNGMGPFGFSTIYGQQPHNVYLEIFLVAGWAGGMAYIILVIATLFVGLRSALVRTPWQSFVIVTIAAFVGEVAEGFIVDTDHWRHYFLLMGMVWGLTAATLKYQQQSR